MTEEIGTLVSLRSSNHRDRTTGDQKTERAYHVLRFLNTDEDRPAPPYGPEPRVRREVHLVANMEVTEADRKLQTEAERKGQVRLEKRPGESQEEFETRKRINNRLRNNQGEWKWVLEDAKRQERWEGKEKVESEPEKLAASQYAVIIPPTSKGMPIKVALLDHWIDMRRSIDNAAQKQELKQKVDRARNAEARREQDEKVKETKERLAVEGLGGTVSGKHPTLKRVKTDDFVRGRDSDAQVKAWKTKGYYDPEGEKANKRVARYDEGHGIDVDEFEAEAGAVNHEYGLAIDRMKEDADEFQDVDHEFDDDDEGQDDYKEGEDNYGFYEGEEALAEARAADVEESDDSDGSDEDDEEGDDSDDEEEEEEEEVSRPQSRVLTPHAPSSNTTSTQSAAVSRPVPLPFSGPAATTVYDIPTSGSLLFRMKHFLWRYWVQRQNKLRTDELNAFHESLKVFFGEEYEKKVFAQALKEMATLIDDSASGKYFVLKDSSAPKFN